MVSLKMDRDGKLLDRVIGAAIPVLVGLLVAGVVWWKDQSNAKERAVSDIIRLETRMDKIEKDATDLRAITAEDRRKTAEINVKVDNIGRGVDRVNAILDRWSTYQNNGQK